MIRYFQKIHDKYLYHDIYIQVVTTYNIYSLFDMLNDNLLHCCTNNIQFTINIKIEFAVMCMQQHTQCKEHCQQIGLQKQNGNSHRGRKPKVYMIRFDQIFMFKLEGKKWYLNGICYENHRQFDGLRLRIFLVTMVGVV